MEILAYPFAGIIIGFIIAFFYFRFKSVQNTLNEKKRWESRVGLVNEEKRALENKVLTLEERLSATSTNLSKAGEELKTTKERNEALSQRVARAEVEYRNLQEKLQTQKAEIEGLQKKFTTEFENIANKILKKNSEEFTIANQKNIGEVLNPLKEKIQQFEKKVDDTYQKGLKDQVDLKAEVKKLYDLNAKISEEANNLTKALKGDVKKQGNWGEVVLERILERSGLSEGREFEREVVVTTDEGKVVRPDVIIHLPDKKHLIVDSKVSLVAYERYSNSDVKEQRKKFIREHLISLKKHVKELSLKHYQTAKGLNSPDFVLLFIPIESSFSLAIQEDQELFSYAWDQKVVIVSPSTLLATLRTIASIWQQENQTRNAMEIARQGGALYDKFVGFIEDMEKIGNNLKTTQGNYEKAMNKLTAGKGNLVKGTEKLRKLGAKASKSIPTKMLEE
ncbi:DNA recombination protein RmuC [hydrothermal vent metagenome]|uniref:DNA recombination protein RmuC n=1 Tax=hydrothermal vent metagenome TaxID=652676 RepID=A0A3B0TGD8_9ZZZZ